MALTSRPRALGALLAVAAAFPGSAQAQSVIRGSTLQASPLTQQQGADCDARWFPNVNNLSGPYVPTARGQDGSPTCTWYQGFVFGDANDPRTGFVPSDGVVRTISVKSAANPAPLTFVVLRQLTPARLGAPAGSTECCFFVRDLGTVLPAPNTTSTFTVNAPVESNRADTVITQDIIGFSAASRTGSIPLGVQDDGRSNRFNEAAHFTNGELTSGYFFPRMGALANDSGGGRHESNTYGGFDVLLQYTFTPGSAVSTPTNPPASGTGTPAAPTTPAGATPATLAPTDVAQIGGAVLRPIGSALDVTIACLQVRCDGTARLLTRGAARAAGAKPLALGAKRFSLAKGAKGKVRVRLNARGRRLSRKGRTRVTLQVDLGAVGTLSRNLTMAKAKRHR